MPQLVLLQGGGAAPPHFLFGDSVIDQSGERRGDARARYEAARRYAISQWNALGRVPILRDSANTPKDLVFRDYRECGSEIIGDWQSGEGPDSINLNVCYMEKHDKSAKRASVAHEIGHTLSLNHPSDKESEYWRKRSIMYFCSSCVPFSAPQAHDKADYREIW